MCFPPSHFWLLCLAVLPQSWMMLRTSLSLVLSHALQHLCAMQWMLMLFPKFQVPFPSSWRPMFLSQIELVYDHRNISNLQPNLFTASLFIPWRLLTLKDLQFCTEFCTRQIFSKFPNAVPLPTNTSDNWPLWPPALAAKCQFSHCPSSTGPSLLRTLPIASSNELHLAPALLWWMGFTTEKCQFVVYKPSTYILLENGSKGSHTTEDFFHCLPFLCLPIVTSAFREENFALGVVWCRE